MTVPSVPKFWCYYCARTQTAVLHTTAEWALYRCGTCRSWLRCPSCAGTMSPQHGCL